MLCRIALVLVLGTQLLMACGNPEKRAREVLEDQGCTAIKLEAQGDGVFTYEAACKDGECRGQIRIDGSSSQSSHRCVSGRAGPREGGLAAPAAAAAAATRTPSKPPTNAVPSRSPTGPPAGKLPTRLSGGCSADAPDKCARLADAFRTGSGAPIAWDRAIVANKLGCEGGDGRQCLLVGFSYNKALGTKPDLPTSARFWDKGCRAGVWQACAYSADTWLSKLHGRTPDDKRGFTEATMACEKGAAFGCSVAGFLTGAGRGGAVKDRPKSLRFLNRACDAGGFTGCRILGNKNDLTSTRDPKAAASAWARGCKLHDPRSCGKLFQLGLRYARGADVPASLSDSARVMETACSLGHPDACAEFGFYLEHGKGVAKDLERAAEHDKRACRMGSLVGCTNVGLKRLKAKDLSGAALIAKACRQGFGSGCAALASRHPDLAVAAASTSEMVRDALDVVCSAAHKVPLGTCEALCKAGAEGACESYAARLPADDANRIALLKALVAGRGAKCDKGDGAACEALARMYLVGSGVAKQPTRYAELQQRACRLGRGPACAAVGARMRAPDKTLTKAGVELLAATCDAGKGAHQACGVLAVHYRDSGAGRLARDMFAVACAKSLDVSGYCVNAANIMSQGTDGLPANVPRAIASARAGCGNGHAGACEWLTVREISHWQTTGGDARMWLR